MRTADDSSLNAELRTRQVVAAAGWSEALKVSPRDPVELLHTRASVRGRPIALSTSAFALPRLAGIGAAVARAGSITAGLRELGIADYTRAGSVVSARLPSAPEADALARPHAQPVLSVHDVNVDRRGVPVEAGCTLFAADAVQLTVEPEE